MNTTTSTSLTFTNEFALDEICWNRLAFAVTDQGIPHVAHDTWQTSATSLDAVAAGATSTYAGEHFTAILTDLGDEIGDPCIAACGLRHGYFTVWLAGWSRETVALAREWVRARMPLDSPTEDLRVAVRFWSWGPRGRAGMSRKIDVTEWVSVRDNYPAAVHPALDRLMALDGGGDKAGQLILWHGPPGTGKTSALRAMAWQWREWCEVHYVTDPDALFGSADYLMSVLLASEDDDDDEDAKWRLLVLEDTGELLSADAKERSGQGLSRLLNTVDGIIGQGLRLLVLVTTNEPLGGLHPAVTRPGRCLASIAFPNFPAAEAATWLAERGHDEAPRGEVSLAQLFATLSGEPLAPTGRRPIGFVR